MVRRIETILKQKIARRKLDGVDYSKPALAQPNADAIKQYVNANRRATPKRFAAQST
jgi:hypothetical protein